MHLDNGTTIKVIAGSVGEVVGPADDIVIDPEYLDCEVPAHTTFIHPTKRGYTVFCYIIGGQGMIDAGGGLDAHNLMLGREGLPGLHYTFDVNRRLADGAVPAGQEEFGKSYR